MGVDDIRAKSVEHLAKAAFDREIGLLLELGPFTLALAMRRPVLQPEVVAVRHAEDGDAVPLLFHRFAGSQAGGGDIPTLGRLRLRQHRHRSLRAADDMWRIEAGEMQDAGLHASTSA